MAVVHDARATRLKAELEEELFTRDAAKRMGFQVQVLIIEPASLLSANQGGQYGHSADTRKGAPVVADPQSVEFQEFFLVPQEGIEPPTHALRMRRSADAI